MKTFLTAQANLRESEIISRTPSTRYAWSVVGMLWFISFFNYADRQALYSVFSLLKKEMDLDKEMLGLLGSSFACVYALGAPFAGYVVDRVRRKTAILGGLHIWSLICMATGWASQFTHLVFFRAAEGLGETFYYPASVSLISDYHGERTRSRALGIHQTSVYVGTIAGGYFAGLIGQYYGWRASFVVFGALGILLGLFLQRFLIEPRRGQSDEAMEPAAETVPHRKMSFRELLQFLGKHPTAIGLMLAFVCANFVAMVLLSWMPNFIEEKFKLSLSMAGLTATFFPQMASMVGAPVGGWLADKLHKLHPGGRILIQTIGVLAGAPFVYLVGGTHTIWELNLFLAAWGLCKGIYDANIFASVFDIIPLEARGAMAGLMNMVGWIGGGAAPVVTGILGNHYGMEFAISSAALVYLMAGFCLIVTGLVLLPGDLKKKAV